MKTATEKELLKAAKISKKIPKRELRRTLARTIPVILMQEKIIKEQEAAHGKIQMIMQGEIDTVHETIRRHDREFVEKEKLTQGAHAVVLSNAKRDVEHIRHEYFCLIKNIGVTLHDNGILPQAKYENSDDITKAIISRVNQIAADFSKARDEQAAQLVEDHRREILDVEKHLESAYDEMRRERDAEVVLRGEAERQLTQAGISAVNAWRAVERAQRPWWRKALAWAKGTGPTFELHSPADGLDVLRGPTLYNKTAGSAERIRRAGE